MTPVVGLSYDVSAVKAVLHLDPSMSVTLRNRVEQRLRQADQNLVVRGSTIYLLWANCLSVIGDVHKMLKNEGVTLQPDAAAREGLEQRGRERKAIAAARDGVLKVSPEEINIQLAELGFRKRILRPFQIRDTAQLLSVPNGANFSVPGAGKTTVMMAVHTLIREPDTHMMVVAPKNAFGAWVDIIDECFEGEVPDGHDAPFVRLDGSPEEIDNLLFQSGQKRFLLTYDRLRNSLPAIRRYLSTNKVHLILDESHNIKAGDASRRGNAALAIAPLPIRRDVLSGTPAPQHTGDLRPQLDFLYPGSDLGRRLEGEDQPREVMKGLYVRTTKSELGLPPVYRHYRAVPMSPGQELFYGIIRSETIRQLAGIHANTGINIEQARRSVMRLLQVSSNPRMALQAMLVDSTTRAQGQLIEVCQQVLAEGHSQKIMTVVKMAQELASEGRKTVIWSIFRENIANLVDLLGDLNATCIHGDVPSGANNDLETREGRVKRFHDDPTCMVMVANPAACSEGVSLHMACHDAIYLERDYNAARYLQSIDRIHRLGLPANVITNVTVLETITIGGVASIDHSVRRRLGEKIANMERILDDQDIRQIALDELETDMPYDEDRDVDDLLEILERQPKATDFGDEKGEVL